MQEKGGAVNSNQESSVMKMLNAHSQKFTSKEDMDASAALLASDPLHASDLFSKEAALKPAEEVSEETGDDEIMARVFAAANELERIGRFSSIAADEG